MITIHEPLLSVRAGAARVSARVETARLGTFELWFEADSTRGEVRMSSAADAFAVAMLPDACRWNEPMRVRGRVSPRLAWGLTEIARVHRAWWPDMVSVPQLQFDRLEEAPATEHGSGAACGFSGGADSMFTLYRHLAGRERVPGFEISRLVMIDGFDNDDDRHVAGLSDALRRVYAPMAARLGLSLVRVSTNVFRPLAMRAPFDWNRWICVLLTAPALALAPTFRRYYIASAEGLFLPEPYGTTPMTDPLFSTDSLQIIHDGGDVLRTGKLEALAQWDEARELLRVCRTRSWTNVDLAAARIDNCGECEKCVRTMVGLRLLGKLHHFRTFRRPLRMRSILRARYEPGASFFGWQNVRLALSQRRYDIAALHLPAIFRAWASDTFGPAARKLRRKIGARP